MEKNDTTSPSSIRIAVVGGTGPQGRGLAYRFAAAGHQVILGSRDPGRAQQAAEDLNAALRAHLIGNTSGDANEAAIAGSDVAVIAVPWDGHEALISSLAETLAGKVVISCVNPLAFDSHGPVGLMLAESAAEQVQRLVPTARVVGAFHHVAAASLGESLEPLAHEDVLVCADDPGARQLVQDLAQSVTGKLGIDAGALRLCRQLEPLTAVLISVNKRYRTRSGIALTGIARDAEHD